MRPVNVPLIRVDYPLLEQTQDLGDFSTPGYELIARCGMLCVLLVDAVDAETRARDQRLNLDEAVIGGLLVRMMKLCRALFEASQAERSEAHAPLTRLLAETAITLRWLVKADNPNSYRRFRADSFAYFRDSGPYSSEGQESDDALAAIIREEIDGRLAAAGVTWEDVPEIDQSWGPDVRQRFEAFGQGMLYRALFKSHSAYVHPTWHELYALHLERDRDGFLLDYTYAGMMPIAAYVVSQVTVEAIRDAARVLPHDLDQKALNDVAERTVEATQGLSVAFADFAERVGFEPDFMA